MYLKDEEITGNYSQALDDAVNAVKGSEERRREYMMLNMRDNEIREEGREEGKILQAIKMYRDLVHYSDEQIIETVMKEFKLTKKEAESYLKPAFA